MRKGMKMWVVIDIGVSERRLERFRSGEVSEIDRILYRRNS